MDVLMGRRSSDQEDDDNNKKKKMKRQQQQHQQRRSTGAATATPARASPTKTLPPSVLTGTKITKRTPTAPSSSLSPTKRTKGSRTTAAAAAAPKTSTMNVKSPTPPPSSPAPPAAAATITETNKKKMSPTKHIKKKKKQSFFGGSRRSSTTTTSKTTAATKQQEKQQKQQLQQVRTQKQNQKQQQPPKQVPKKEKEHQKQQKQKQLSKSTPSPPPPAPKQQQHLQPKQQQRLPPLQQPLRQPPAAAAPAVKDMYVFHDDDDDDYSDDDLSHQPPVANVAAQYHYYNNNRHYHPGGNSGHHNDCYMAEDVSTIANDTFVDVDDEFSVATMTMMTMMEGTNNNDNNNDDIVVHVEMEDKETTTPNERGKTDHERDDIVDDDDDHDHHPTTLAATAASAVAAHPASLLSSPSSEEEEEEEGYEYDDDVHDYSVDMEVEVKQEAEVEEEQEDEVPSSEAKVVADSTADSDADDAADSVMNAVDCVDTNNDDESNIDDEIKSDVDDQVPIVSEGLNDDHDDDIIGHDNNLTTDSRCDDDDDDSLSMSIDPYHQYDHTQNHDLRRIVEGEEESNIVDDLSFMDITTTKATPTTDPETTDVVVVDEDYEMEEKNEKEEPSSENDNDNDDDDDDNNDVDSSIDASGDFLPVVDDNDDDDDDVDNSNLEEDFDIHVEEEQEFYPSNQQSKANQENMKLEETVTQTAVEGTTMILLGQQTVVQQEQIQFSSHSSPTKRTRTTDMYDQFQEGLQSPSTNDVIFVDTTTPPVKKNIVVGTNMIQENEFKDSKKYNGDDDNDDDSTQPETPEKDLDEEFQDEVVDDDMNGDADGNTSDGYSFDDGQSMVLWRFLDAASIVTGTRVQASNTDDNNSSSKSAAINTSTSTNATSKKHNRAIISSNPVVDTEASIASSHGPPLDSVELPVVDGTNGKKDEESDGILCVANTQEDNDGVLVDAVKPNGKKTGFTQSRRFLCKLTCACLVGFVLLGAIGVLGYTLYELKTQDDPSIFGFQLRPRDDAGTSDTTGDSSSSSSSSPNIQKRLDFLREQIPQLGTIPGLSVDEWTYILYDESSIQYRVVEWLANDPNVTNYSNSKILQRYALGCFYWSLMDNAVAEIDVAVSNDTAIADVRSTWMSYQDECSDWSTTGSEGHQMCDQTGRVVSLHLEKVELSGTLAEELSLLSNSLQQVFLTDNTIYGPIPPSMGSLKNLRRLQLPRNSMSGRIPTEIGLWNNLEVLSLGRNVFSNLIPSEIGMMTNLRYLNLHHNDLQGQIPTEIGNLSKIEFLSLQGNVLTGYLPDQVSTLTSLTAFNVEENDLSGSVPEGLCNIATVRGDLAITVDCDSVECSCCTPSCEDNPQMTTQTTQVPTAAPTLGYPSIDVATIQQNLATQSYVIDVGMDCYDPSFVIDFTSELSDPTEYDVVVLVPLPSSAIANVSLGDAFFSLTEPDSSGEELSPDSTVLGSSYNLFQYGLYWASSCDLTECDGVFADGVLYYRNKFPTWFASQPALWPLRGGGFYQVHLVQVDATGTAYVMGRSRPFIVASNCPDSR